MSSIVREIIDDFYEEQKRKQREEDEQRELRSGTGSKEKTGLLKEDK